MSAINSLVKKARAFNTPEDRAAIEDAQIARGDEPVVVNAPVKDPEAETKLLRHMLAEQQVALRRSMRAALDSEKAAEEASAKLNQTQDELKAREKDLTREKLDLQRSAVTSSEMVNTLRAELRAAHDALRNAQDKGDSQRRLVGGLVTGFIVALVAMLLVMKYRPAPERIVTVTVPAQATASPAKEPPKPTESQALDRLNHVLQEIPPQSIPLALDQANRWLTANGSPPCSLQWTGGERAVIVSKGKETGAPLAEAFDRCATALERR